MDPAITNILIALIAAGLLTYVRDAFKWLAARRRAGTSEGRESARVGLVDQNLLVVSKARDELAEDNKRLRATLSEERHRHDEERRRFDADRVGWDEREAKFRTEIEGLETRVRDILTELTALKDRSSPPTPPHGLPAVPARS